MTIYLATGNKHKKQEVSEILSEYTVKIPSDEEIDFSPEETGTTFFENSLIKAKNLYEKVKQPVLADDSGICVDELNGQPGIYSARFGETETYSPTQKEKNALLISKMIGKKNRSCRFVCCMTLYLGNDRFFVSQETLEGILTTEEAGIGGFGYDPIVFLPKYNKTVAELSEKEKNEISHRGKALNKIKKILAIL